MKYDSRKGYQLRYELTDKRIRSAIIKVIKSGQEPTVRLVAKEAGVGITTAYAHKCHEMIMEVLEEIETK